MQHVTKLERMDGWGGEERKQKCSQEDGVRKERTGKEASAGCGTYLHLEDTVLAWADVGVHGQTYKHDAHELTQLLSRFCGSMCS